MIPELSYLGYYGEISEILSTFPAFSQSLDLHSPPAVLNFLYVLSLWNSGVLHIIDSRPLFRPFHLHRLTLVHPQEFHDLIAVDPDLIVSFFL